MLLSPAMLLFSRTRLRSYPTGSLAFLTAWQGWKQTKFRGRSWLPIPRKTFNGRYMTCFVVCCLPFAFCNRSRFSFSCVPPLSLFHSQVRYSLKTLASFASARIHLILGSSLTLYNVDAHRMRQRVSPPFRSQITRKFCPEITLFSTKRAIDFDNYPEPKV